MRRSDADRRFHGASPRSASLDLALPDNRGRQFGIPCRVVAHTTISNNPPKFIYLARLALKPTILARMHGSAWRGDGAKLLLALGETFGTP
jgi:hypothetical protein